MTNRRNPHRPAGFRMYRILDAAAKVYAGLVQLVGRSDLEGSRGELIEEALNVAVEMESAIADELAEDIPPENYPHSPDWCPPEAADPLAWAAQKKPEPGRFYLIRAGNVSRVAFCNPDETLQLLIQAGSIFDFRELKGPRPMDWLPLPDWDEAARLQGILRAPQLDDGGDTVPE